MRLNRILVHTFAGILFFQNAVWAAPRIETKDSDADSQVDIWNYYEGEKRIRTARDTNKDGQPDQWQYFVRPGYQSLREYDKNYDGRVDVRQFTELTFRADLKIHQHAALWVEEDQNHDGVIDKFRARGVKDPQPSPVGQPMNTQVTETWEAPASESQAEQTGVQKLINERSDLENAVQESQEKLK